VFDSLAAGEVELGATMLGQIQNLQLLKMPIQGQLVKS